MYTATAILLTQFPIAIAILIGAYTVYLIRKDMIEILKKLSENKK